MAFTWKPNPYFTPTAYVSPAGNDINDGSAQKPYRTLQKCKDAGKYLIQVATGFYRESPNFSNAATTKIFGDGIVIIDGFLISNVFATGNVYTYSVTLQNFSNTFGNTYSTFNKTFLKNVKDYYYWIQGDSQFNVIVRNSNLFQFVYLGYQYNVTNITFKNCNLQFANFGITIKYHIFSDCDIYINADLPIIFCLFYNCRFKIKSESAYSYLTGVNPADKLANLKSRWLAQYSSSSNTFQGCSCEDPLFNNAPQDDYTLHPNSPARHMAYDGSFIGAFDVSYPIKPYDDDLTHPNGFYNASKGANILASNTKLSLSRNADGSSVGGGQIVAKPQDLTAVYELRTILANQQIADRNREWIDTNADIDMTDPIYPGTAITVGESYVVESGSVTYNSITYATRSKFIAVTGQTAFTSSDGGYLYLIKESPNRATCEMRFKQVLSGVTVTPGNNLTENSWYKASGAVTWNSKVIPDGDSFQAIAGALAFTGGNCIEMFTEADTWSEFEIGEKPTCKRVGNVAAGAIDIGTDGKPLTNGHKEFYTTGNIARASQIIQARYIQYRLTFQNKMLK